LPFALAATLLTMPATAQTLTVAQSSTATPSPAPVQADFEGIRLGDSASALVARLGEPLLAQVQVADGISETDYLYLNSYGNALLFVHILRGNVAGISMKPVLLPPVSASTAPMPSALGVALGDPASKIEALPKNQLMSVNTSEGDVTSTYRGANGWQYVFTNTDDKVAWIEVYLMPAALKALPNLPEPTLHTGNSIADAIAIAAPTEKIGIQAEYIYVAAHPCTNGGQWHGSRAPIIRRNGRTYDQLLATCSTDSTRRSFFFDTTAIPSSIRGL
jgi:hypothetical protein